VRRLEWRRFGLGIANSFRFPEGGALIIAGAREVPVKL
jgi:hypothetical protein